MNDRNITQYYELAAYVLGYDENDYLSMLDDGTLKERLKLEIAIKLNVSFSGFIAVVDALLPLTPAIAHIERINIIHAFVKVTNTGEQPQIIISAKNKANFSISR